MNIPRPLSNGKKSRLFLAFFPLVLAALLLFTALPTRAANPDYKIAWTRTRYSDNVLNAEKLCTIKTEYPVYQTGATELYMMHQSNTSRTLCYNVTYALEQKRSDGWYTQQFISEEDITISDPLSIPLPPKSTKGLRVPVLSLEAGQYRIIKPFIIKGAEPYKEYLLCTEFTVADDGYDSAQLSGYAPLASLTEAYTHEQAIADGVFYVDLDEKVYNKSALFTFLQKMQQGVKAKLRLLEDGIEGQFIVSDITYFPGESQPLRYLVETCTLRDPMQLAVYVDGKPLQTKYKKSEIYSRYYPYLITRKVDGETRLTLSDWVGTPIKEAYEWPIVFNTAKLGTSRVKALLLPPGEGSEAAYHVYKPDGSSYASYRYDEDEHRLACLNQRKGMQSYRLELPDGAPLGTLLFMEWQSPSLLRLTFETESGARRMVLFHAWAGKILSISEG